MRGRWEPDHTKPTLAFLALVVIAAATIGGNLSRDGGDVVAATDQPGRGAVATPVPAATAGRSPASSSSPFSLAAVVTLAPRPEDAAATGRSVMTTGDRTPPPAPSWSTGAPGGPDAGRATATRRDTRSGGSGGSGGPGGSTAADPGPGRSGQHSGATRPPAGAGSGATAHGSRKAAGPAAGAGHGAGHGVGPAGR